MSESETIYTKISSLSSWIKQSEIALPNRGLNYGDGIFETLFFDGKDIRFASYHLKRVKEALALLQISETGVQIEAMLQVLRTEFAGQKLRLRWNLIRSGAGKFLPEENGLIQTLQVEPFRRPQKNKKEAFFSTTVKLSFSRWSRYKTLNALAYVMAALERRERGLDEIILPDLDGHISEAGYANLFWRKGEQVFTPALSTGCIAGVGRAVILDTFRASGREVQEGSYTFSHILNAEQVWVSNALGISYVEKIENSEYSTEAWEPLEAIFK